MLEDPGISNRPARDPDDVHAGFLEHSHRILCCENIATAENRAIGKSLFYLPQKFPPALAVVFLLHRPPMYARGGAAILENKLQQFPKLIRRLGRIIESPPQTDREHRLGQRIAH